MTKRYMRLCRNGRHRGRDALASVTRVSNTQIKRYEDEGDPLIMPLDIAVEMEALLDYPHFASFLADVQGYDLVKRNAGRGDSLLGLMARSVKEAAEAHETILEAEADGKQTLEEWQQIAKEAADAKDAFAEIEEKAKRNYRREMEAKNVKA